jgi:soluble lytic murein transglycosylase-like protein
MIAGSMRRSGLGYSLLTLFLLLAFPSAALAGGRSAPSPEDSFDAIIQNKARDFGVDAALVKAVIAAESSFEPGAVSRVGALGLMQLMPETAAWLGVEDPLDADQSIEGGTRYLREMLDRYGDTRRALAAYNAGPDAVDKFDGVPPYRETRVYVLRVLDFYRGYRAESGSAKRIRAARRAPAAPRRIRPETAEIELIRGTTRSYVRPYE